MADELGNNGDLGKILLTLREIKEEVAKINSKTENNYKWLGKLANRILPISIAVTVIEILILIGLGGIIYLVIKFFVFTDTGKSIIAFLSNFAK
jgi:hypothetical protein